MAKSTHSTKILLIAASFLALLAAIHVYSTYPCVLPRLSGEYVNEIDLLLTPSDMGSSWTYTSVPGQRKAQRYGRYHPDWTKRVELRSIDGYSVSVDAMEFPCEAAATDAVNDVVDIILGTGAPTETDKTLRSIFGESSMTLVDTKLIEDVFADVRTYCDARRFPACEVVIQSRGKFFLVIVNRSGAGIDRSVVSRAAEVTIDRIRIQARP